MMKNQHKFSNSSRPITAKKMSSSNNLINSMNKLNI